MSAVVADTQSIVWYLTRVSKLSPAAIVALDASNLAGDPIYVATISIVEIIYLVEKGRLPQEVLDKLIEVLADPVAGYKPIPLDVEIAQIIHQIPRNVVPEMPDRIIAATALYLGLPLVTSDHKIHATSVQTIW